MLQFGFFQLWIVAISGVQLSMYVSAPIWSPKFTVFPIDTEGNVFVYDLPNIKNWATKSSRHHKGTWYEKISFLVTNSVVMWGLTIFNRVQSILTSELPMILTKSYTRSCPGVNFGVLEGMVRTWDPSGCRTEFSRRRDFYGSKFVTWILSPGKTLDVAMTGRKHGLFVNLKHHFISLVNNPMCTMDNAVLISIPYSLLLCAINAKHCSGSM